MKKQENKRRNRVEAFDKQFFLVLIPLILLMILFFIFSLLVYNTIMVWC